MFAKANGRMDKSEEEGSNSKQFIVYKNASSDSGGAFLIYRTMIYYCISPTKTDKTLKSSNIRLLSIDKTPKTYNITLLSIDKTLM